MNVERCLKDLGLAREGSKATTSGTGLAMVSDGEGCGAQRTTVSVTERCRCWAEDADPTFLRILHISEDL